MDYSPKHVIRKAKLDYIELTLIMISHFVIKKTVSITLILRMGWRWWRWFSKTRSLSDKNCLLLNIQACKVTVKIDVKSAPAPPPPPHTHTHHFPKPHSYRDTTNWVKSADVKKSIIIIDTLN